MSETIFSSLNVTDTDLPASRESAWPARGAIVNVASQAGLMGNGDLPAYVASKHGVVGLSKSVSESWYESVLDSVLTLFARTA